jgi:multisubunit Na+/H+ antiporter MnhG subunit
MFIMEIGASNWQKACFVHQIIYLVFLFLAQPTTTHENLSTIKETVPIYQ